MERLIKFLLFFIILLFLSCTAVINNSTDTGGDTSVDDAAADDSTTDSTVETEASFANAFPSDLVIASPTEAIPGVLPGAIPSYFKYTSTTENENSFESKAEVLGAILEGDEVSDCDFTFNPVSSAGENVSCYGPTLYYTGHPDITVGDGSGVVGGGDLGIWSATNGDQGEACSAAQLNSKINNISALIDSSIYMVASLKCIADVNSLTPPTAGGTPLDLTDKVNSAYTTNDVGLTLISATLSQEEADASGNPVWVTNIVGTYAQTSSLPIDELSIDLEISCRLKHIPTNDDNSLYKGKLSCVISYPTTENQSNCTVTGVSNAISISYEKSSATVMSYELYSGQFCGSDANPYVSATNYSVDRTKVISDTESNGWGNNFSFGRFSINPETGIGDFHFGWQAGYGDGYTRVLNGSLSSDAEANTTTGSIFFGFGPDIAGEDDPVGLYGMFCNWSGPGSDKAVSGLTEQVERQDISLTSDAIYVPTNSYITFVPTNSCNSTAEDNFCYGLEEDNLTCEAVTNNLVSLDSITIANPTAPTDVDE